MSLVQDIIFSFKMRCPKCKQGKLFKGWSMEIVDKCDVCGVDLGHNDIGDGASVFLIFALGFTLVPLGWAINSVLDVPFVIQLIVLSVVICGAAAVLLPAVKAYIMILEFRHRRKD